MKIVCPNCSARYEVELPGLAARDVRVKCVKCQQKFMLEGAVRSSSNSSTTAAAATGNELGSEEKLAASSETERTALAAGKNATFDREALAPEQQLADEETEEFEDSLPEAAPAELADENIAAPALGEIEAADPLAAMQDDALQSDITDTEINPIDFDDEFSPQSENADTEKEPAGKDDLDDLLNQILDGKMEVTEAAAASEPLVPKATEKPPTSGNLGPEESFSPAMERDLPEVEPETASPAPFSSGQASGEMPFLEDVASEGKSEVDRWAEAFAEEGLDRSMEEELNSLDLPLEGESGQSAAPLNTMEDIEEPPDMHQGPDLKEIAEEVALLDKDEKKEKSAKRKDGEKGAPKEKPAVILARKKKNSLFSLPATRTGKAVFYGGLLALALGAGALYMLQETLLPEELLNLRKTTAPLARAPETKKISSPEQAITPASKPPADDAALPPAENKTKPTLSGVQDTPQPQEKETPVSTEEAVPEVVKELSALKSKGGAEEVEPVTEPSKGLEAALSPRKNAVTLSTIMPVAYSAREIRVLSFSLVMELTDAESAEAVREALPIFENATVATVDSMLEDKFFNDILYIKEKLKTDLKTAFNEIIVGGRVKRVQFEDFLVQ